MLAQFKRVNGAAVRSFGAEVALMAGLPKSVADNATNIAQQSAVIMNCFSPLLLATKQTFKIDIIHSAMLDNGG